MTRCRSCDALRANIVEHQIELDRERRINSRLSRIGYLTEDLVDADVSDARFRHLIRAQVRAWREASQHALEERTGRSA